MWDGDGEYACQRNQGIVQTNTICHIRCFLGQAPAASVALLLILWKLPANMKPADDDQKTPSFRQNLSRVDFAGFFTLSSALITAFVALDLAGKFYSWTYICPLAITSLSLFILFYWIETKYANEPIMPMQLLAQRDVVTSYLLVALQTAAQFVVSQHFTLARFMVELTDSRSPTQSPSTFKLRPE